MLIACGQCVGCRLDRSRSWATRIMHERHEHELTCFLTLTYDNHYLPQNGTLVKKHFQDFMKRLRADHEYNNPEAPKIKYYMCGEYGGNTNRPHYHAIVFGLDFADKRKHSKGKRGDQLFTSKKLDQLWRMGHCWIGSVTHQSAGYVARYCLKKINGERAFDHYSTLDQETGEIIQRLPEYAAGSNGIGLAHFEKYHDQMYLRDSCVIEGKEVPIPKYYDKKLEEIDPARLEKIKAQRVIRAKLRAADTTFQRLADRETIKLSQINLLKRDLHND